MSDSGGRLLEFTAPAPDAPKRARKPKWEFRLASEPRFCIAGLWRPCADGEAFTMLTTAPGADIAPYHDRQIVVLGREAWGKWLDGPEPESLLRSLPAGALTVERVGP